MKEGRGEAGGAGGEGWSGGAVLVCPGMHLEVRWQLWSCSLPPPCRFQAYKTNTCLLSHLSSPAWFGFKPCSLDFITCPPNQTPFAPATPSLHLFLLHFVLVLIDVRVTGQGLRSVLHLGQQRRLFSFLGNRLWHQAVTTADVQGRLSF